MNDYKAFYRGKTLIVEGNTSYEAQQNAARAFSYNMRNVKRQDVVVVLIAKDGEQVTHSTSSI